MRELESDRDMRSKLNLYKRTDVKAKKTEEATGMDVEGGGERVTMCSAVLVYLCWITAMISQF